jgi:hypothetical protein
VQEVGDGGVLEPGHPDGGEADQVGQERGPLGQKRPEEIVAASFRHRDLEYEEGDGDGEYPIAEGFEPSGAQPGGQENAPRMASV